MEAGQPDRASVGRTMSSVLPKRWTEDNSPHSDFHRSELTPYQEWFENFKQETERKTTGLYEQLFGNATHNLTWVGPVFIVVGVGAIEGLLLTRRGAAGRGFFAFSHGWLQVLPSMVQKSKPPELVAQNVGCNPKLLLRNLGEDSTIPARRRARINWGVHFCKTLRTIVANLIGLTGVVRLVECGSEASKEYEKSVLEGREPLFEGVDERVLRLAGVDSAVTELSVRNHGNHIVPVYEEPDNVIVKSMVEQHSNNGRVPFFWHVASDSYSRPESWGAKSRRAEDLADAQLGIHQEWTLPVETGGRALVIEADSSAGESEFNLDFEAAETNDLTLQETSQAFRMIDRIAKARGVAQGEKDKIWHVLLSNSVTLVQGLKSRDGTSTDARMDNNRNKIKLEGAADIIIDAQKPVIAKILEFAGRMHSSLHKHDPEAPQSIKILTEKRSDFDALKMVLQLHCWEVHDWKHEDWSSLNLKEPLLVYGGSSDNTVNTILNLWDAGANPELVFGLITRQLDSDYVKHLAEAHKAQADQRLICSAEIYDDIFREIREAIRSGRTPEEIQKTLDDDNKLEECLDRYSSA